MFKKDSITAPSPASAIRLRPLERGDLYFVHRLDNNANVMRYWFEEPYETFDELTHLYDEHIRDQRERRFVIEYGSDEGGKRNNIAGLVELVEIDHIHRRAEYQIIVAPDYQGKGIATRATELALEYGVSVLNLYKIYLIVDVENAGARHVYEKIGFQAEGTLRHEFFINGQYRDVTRMCLFQHEYLQRALTATP